MPDYPGSVCGICVAPAWIPGATKELLPAIALAPTPSPTLLILALMLSKLPEERSSYSWSLRDPYEAIFMFPAAG